MKKILITGGPGFAATQLIKYLLSEDSIVGSDFEGSQQKGGIEIHATKRVRSDMYRSEKMKLIDQVKWHLVEMTDAISVINLIVNVMPDQIYHLAAQDYVKSSWSSPNETFHTNVNGTINLFEAIRQCYDPGMIKIAFDKKATSECLDYPKVLITSTSETYGYHDAPINEMTEQLPANPYGISKATQDALSRLYADAYQIPVVITRSFNITGWGRNEPFVDSSFAKQIAEAEVGIGTGEIKHGNLSSKRTFFDVKEAVEGYYLAMQHKIPDGDNYEVYCFGKRHSTSIQELLNILMTKAQTMIRPVKMIERLRPVDTPDMVCNPTKAKSLLNWEAKISLEESLSDLLNYWRGRIK